MRKLFGNVKTKHAKETNKVKVARFIITRGAREVIHKMDLNVYLRWKKEEERTNVSEYRKKAVLSKGLKLLITNTLTSLY